MPFTGESIRGLTPAEIIAHTTLKTTINSGNLSAAIGRFVVLGSEFVERGAREITEGYISRVARHLEGAMSDVVPSYAIVMWFVKEVRWLLVVVPLFILINAKYFP